jgi:hypothetical protein
MKRARFSPEQIFGVLKEVEAGAKIADLARRHGDPTAAGVSGIRLAIRLRRGARARRPQVLYSVDHR